MKRDNYCYFKAAARFLRPLLLLLIAFSTLFPTAAMAQELRASVDRSKVSINESFTLTLRYTGNSNAAPNLDGLEQDFDILTQNQSSQYRSFNGRVESYTDWVLVLMPKREGSLQIPPITIPGSTSQPLEITVTPEQPGPSGQSAEIFVETEVDKSNSYVQEQIRLTFRLYFSVNIDSLNREELSLENVLIEELPDVKYRRHVDGRPYTVVEFSYALHPQTSGPFTIPAMQWTLQLSRSQRRDIYSFGSGRYDVKRLRTEEKTIDVKAQPNAFPSTATWLPSTKVTLQENWSKDPATMTAGEPLTRTIILKAEGLNSSQLPAIPTGNEPKSLKFYPEQPSLNDQASEYGISGNRQESYAVVASKAGQITIPAVKLPWWDVENQEVKYAEIPARTISIAAGATSNEPDISSLPPAISNVLEGDSSNTTGAATSSKQAYWQALAIASLIASLVLSGLWLNTRNQLQKLKNGNQEKHSKQTRQKKLKENEAFNQIKSACEAGQPEELRNAIINWLKVKGDISKGTALKDFIQKLADTTLQQELRNLDAAIYGKGYGKSDDAIHFNTLLKALEGYRESAKKPNALKENTDLPPLYAQT